MKMINLNKPGIYIILNKTKNKKYIGQSIKLKNRYQKHKSLLKNNKHPNTNMQFDYSKGDIFKFIPIKNCFTKVLNKMEIFFIKKYNTYLGFGYNKSIGGDTLGFGNMHPCYKQTLYTFYHENGRIEKDITQFEMKQKYSLSRHLSAVCLGKTKSIKGWSLITTN